jgi:hypothetical protein
MKLWELVRGIAFLEGIRRSIDFPGHYRLTSLRSEEPSPRHFTAKQQQTQALPIQL